MISAIAVEKPSVAWPAAKVEVWPIERLTANPRNARIHGREQIEQIRASLREFGWTMSVLVRENGMLIAGHGRLEAAKLEGITEVPTIVARGWTEAQCQAYAICDNAIADAQRRTLIKADFLQACGAKISLNSGRSGTSDRPSLRRCSQSAQAKFQPVTAAIRPSYCRHALRKLNGRSALTGRSSVWMTCSRYSTLSSAV